MAEAIYTKSIRANHFKYLAYLAYGVKICNSMINTLIPTTKKLKFTEGDKSWTDLAMAPMSAPILNVLAAKSSIVLIYSTFLPKWVLILLANPLPVTKPILAHISWTMAINGKVKAANQRRPRPY